MPKVGITIEHQEATAELSLREVNILHNEDIRWLVFKVKKRAKQMGFKKAVPENNYTGAQKRAAERKTLNAMRRKSTDMNSYDELKGFWKDNSDTYTKRKTSQIHRFR